MPPEMRGTLVCVLWCLGLLANAEDNRPMKLRLLSKHDGAVCLDGTPGGYYFAPGSGEDADKWIVFLQGGGWCYGAADCYERSRASYGSSNYWMQEIKCAEGPMLCDCTQNALFCNYNKVYVNYCDGDAFVGDRDEPLVHGDRTLHFRGRRIVEALFDDLNDIAEAPRPWREASAVLFTGCSAGGMAVYLHADRIAARLPPSVKRFGALPISGMFVDHANAEGKPVFSSQLRSLYAFANSSLPDACLASVDPDERWKCHFPQFVYPHIKTRVYPLNSMHDSWQIACVLTSEPVPPDSASNGDCASAPGWRPCLKHGHCTTEQMESVRALARTIVTSMTDAETSRRPGNGGFVDACPRHCGPNMFWNIVRVDGLTYQEAVARWWNGPADAPSDSNWHVDPPYNLTEPYQPNPTCDVKPA